MYSQYKEGLHDFIILAYCDSSIKDKFIDIHQLEKISKLLDKELMPKIAPLENSSNPIVEKLYVLENGKFEQCDVKIRLFTEDCLISSLVDFTRYLEKIVIDYEKTRLPFTTSNRNLTLENTFVSPFYNKGNESLDSLIDQYLQEEGNRHIAILGSYGMGKTSFLKHYCYILAKKILAGETITRFPVFISLTNTSPMHDGIKTKCESFVSRNLGCNYKIFEKLIHKGKIIFFLDGFDEMGFIGTHKQRFNQLNAIWRLATERNKIIISGRPSYFPTENEMVISLNLVEEKLVPSDLPYCTRVELDEFSEDQIKLSIEKLYPQNVAESYYTFIKDNQSIYYLCRRPSMLHIVREMLPILLEKGNQFMTSSNLMEQYVNHWIERQESKKIQSALTIGAEKQVFIKDFFSRLAGEHYKYENGNIQINSYDLSRLLRSQVFRRYFNQADRKNSDEHFILNDKSSIEGLENELMTGYFIYRLEDSYKFVHKSFFEFFVSKSILSALENKEHSSRVVYEEDWTEEISNYVLESDEKLNKKPLLANVPFLISLTSDSNFSAKLRYYLLIFLALINSSFLLKITFLLVLFLISYLLFSSWGIGIYICSLLFGTYLGLLYLKRNNHDIEDGFYYFISTQFSAFMYAFEKIRTKKVYRFFTECLKVSIALCITIFGLAQLYVSSYMILDKNSFVKNPNNWFGEFKTILSQYILDTGVKIIKEFSNSILTLIGVILVAFLFYAAGFFVGNFFEKFVRVKFSAKAYILEMKNKKIKNTRNDNRVSLFYSKIYNKRSEVNKLYF